MHSDNATQPLPDSAVPVIPARTKYLWTRPEPFRVHHYDKSRKGTWFAFFATVEEAQAFAAGKCVWGRSAVVESKLASEAS